MASRAGVIVTRTKSRIMKPKQKPKSKSSSGSSGSRRTRCPTCGKFMGSGKGG